MGESITALRQMLAASEAPTEQIAVQAIPMQRFEQGTQVTDDAFKGDDLRKLRDALALTSDPRMARQIESALGAPLDASNIDRGVEMARNYQAQQAEAQRIAKEKREQLRHDSEIAAAKFRAHQEKEAEELRQAIIRNQAAEAKLAELAAIEAAHLAEVRAEQQAAAEAEARQAQAIEAAQINDAQSSKEAHASRFVSVLLQETEFAEFMDAYPEKFSGLESLDVIQLKEKLLDMRAGAAFDSFLRGESNQDAPAGHPYATIVGGTISELKLYDDEKPRGRLLQRVAVGTGVIIAAHTAVNSGAHLAADGSSSQGSLQSLRAPATASLISGDSPSKTVEAAPAPVVKPAVKAETPVVVAQHVASGFGSVKKIGHKEAIRRLTDGVAAIKSQTTGETPLATLVPATQPTVSFLLTSIDSLSSQLSNGATPQANTLGDLQVEALKTYIQTPNQVDPQITQSIIDQLTPDQKVAADKLQAGIFSGDHALPQDTTDIPDDYEEVISSALAIIPDTYSTPDVSAPVETPVTPPAAPETSPPAATDPAPTPPPAPEQKPPAAENQPVTLNFEGYKGTAWASAEAQAKLKENLPVYVEVGKEFNLPWQLFAVAHFREHALSVSNPSNGQGIYQFYAERNSGNYPTGPVSQEEFLKQTRHLAQQLRDDYSKRGQSDKDVAPGLLDGPLSADKTSANRVKDLFFSFNGRANAYADQAQMLDYAGRPWEGSPYVMNLADTLRDSSHDSDWKQFLYDPGTKKHVMGPANDSPGAWIMFKDLVGISGENDKLVNDDNYKPSYEMDCPDGTKDLGIVNGGTGGHLLKIRVCSILGLPSSSDESTPGSKYYVDGADGNAIVNVSIAGHVLDMVKAAKDDGVTLTVQSSYRSFGHQSDLWDASGHDNSVVGTVNGSNHRGAKAIDWGLDGEPLHAQDYNTQDGGAPSPDNPRIAPNSESYNWLAKNADKFGFKQYPNEPWHWSPNGH